MGSFRLLLAAAVMLGHFAPLYPQHLPYLMSSSAAVPAFYIVSGFLITLVLREKYRDRTGLFYSNRALRIFPLYWAALAIYLLVNWLVVDGHLPGDPAYPGASALWWWQRHHAENGIIATALLVLSNIAIVGQDMVLFIGKWPNLLNRDYFYHLFMYVGPAWTIEVEFCFYAIAPFVVRRGIIWPITLLAASLGARLIAVFSGSTGYIESYDFPPFEMTFFMAGSLAYRAYGYLRTQKSRWVSAYSFAACATIGLLSVFYLFIPFARPIYLLAVCICLPGIVLVGRRNPLDNVCGELSYPVYLLHAVFTLWIIPGVTVWAEIIAVLATLGISTMLVFGIDRPIEAIRQRRAERSARTDVLTVGQATLAAGRSGWH